MEHSSRKRNIVCLLLLAAVVCAFLCLFVGSSGMSAAECLQALLGRGTPAQIRILRQIRLPRVLAAMIAGGGLSVSGLMMQTNLNNPMASPSTLGVSNAAVFGANLSIIAFAGGYLSTGHNVSNYSVGMNPYAASAVAFLFSVGAADSGAVPPACLFPQCGGAGRSGRRLGVDSRYNHPAILCHRCRTFRRSDLELWRSGPGYL